jgi:hypothetical protein
MGEKGSEHESEDHGISSLIDAFIKAVFSIKTIPMPVYSGNSFVWFPLFSNTGFRSMYGQRSKDLVQMEEGI